MGEGVGGAVVGNGVVVVVVGGGVKCTNVVLYDRLEPFTKVEV